MALRLLFTPAPPKITPLVEPPKITRNNRICWVFEEGTLFKESKTQIVTEIEDVMKIVGVNRFELARRMRVQASAVTQSLAINKGLQLTTLVRMADALECDVEVNLIRRGPYTGRPTSQSVQYG